MSILRQNMELWLWGHSGLVPLGGEEQERAAGSLQGTELVCLGFLCHWGAAEQEGLGTNSSPGDTVQCHWQSLWQWGHTGCMQWPGAAWQPAQDPCSAGSAQGEERGRGAQSRVTAGTWLSWLGQWNPSLLCNQVQVHTTAAHSFIFSPFSTEVLQKFLLINANYLFPLEFREKQGEPENLIEQCQKQQSSDPVLWDKQRRRGKGAWDHGARGHLLLPQPSLPPRFGESCRVQHEKKKNRYERTGACSWHSQCHAFFLLQVKTKVWNWFLWAKYFIWQIKSYNKISGSFTLLQLNIRTEITWDWSWELKHQEIMCT